MVFNCESKLCSALGYQLLTLELHWNLSSVLWSSYRRLFNFSVRGAITWQVSCNYTACGSTSENEASIFCTTITFYCAFKDTQRKRHFYCKILQTAFRTKLGKYKIFRDHLLPPKEMPRETLCILTHIHHASEEEQLFQFHCYWCYWASRSLWALKTVPKL